ncbi:MAG: polysaccharide biosynthesis protein [Clostridia bacterium]|nr:polysaccharide biosynthesis protein [Clostridia bacterium]
MFRNRFLLIIDAILIFMAYIGSIMLVTLVDIEQFYIFLNSTITILALDVIILFFCNWRFGIYSTLWIYGGLKDYFNLIKASFISTAISIVITLVIRASTELMPQPVFPLTEEKIIIFISFMNIVTLLFMFLLRLVACVFYNRTKLIRRRNEGKRLLIYGAGSAAMTFMHDLMKNEDMDYRIVGFIDDAPDKKKARINGYPVLGQGKDVVRIANDYDIDEIIIAIPSATLAERTAAVERCSKTKKTVKIMPSIDRIILDSKDNMMIKNVDIEDLLERDPIKLEKDGIKDFLEDKVVFVSGGGGSIGSELCRQIMKFNPKQLIIFDIYENNAYEIQMELNRKYPDNKPTVLIGSVRDIHRLEAIFEEYKPEVVFHAAAHKHVPLMEDSPGEAIKNNVFGTVNMAKAADLFGVKTFVMVSTDKAVNPTNIMGASKRMCEMVIQTIQTISKTKFVAVRFGNVLGSNGSVIPLFKKQIAQGGPVTITHRDITRYFMTIPEASQLVLQAGAFAEGGEVFVLDMGKPVKIYDLAKHLIKLSGFEPGVDIKIEEVGLRPGEKIYEELLMSEEGLEKTRNEKIFVGRPTFNDYVTLNEDLQELKDAILTRDKVKIKAALKKSVPTFVEPEEVNNAK